MKQINNVLLCALCLLPMGCVSSNSEENPNPKEGETYPVLMGARKLSKAEVKVLVRKEKAGDGAAAFALFSNYSLGDYNARLSEKYYKRAVELEHPAALYEEAFRAWSWQEQPDLAYVERLVRRAIELGYKDEKGLLAEVVAARESGIVPRRSKFRLFPEAEAKSKP